MSSVKLSSLLTRLWPRAPFVGVALALAAAALFGLSAPLSKILLTHIDPQLLAGLLYLGAGLGLAILSLFRASGHEAPLRRADAPWMALVLLFGGVAAPLLLMLGLAQTDAASGALLLNLESVATLALAWLVFHENVDRRLLLGALAIVLGASLLSFQGGFALDRGAGLIALACVCWGVDNNLTRKLSAADPVQIAMIKGFGAGAVNLLIALALGAKFGAKLPSPGLAAGAALVGFLGVGLSLTLYIRALRHLGAARAGAYFALAPFIGAVAALLIAGEAPSLQLVAAGALMGLGLWLHLTEHHAHRHVHEPLEHEHAHVHDAHHQHDHDGPVSAAPHSHRHRHERLTHAHAHYPDIHHRHGHAPE